MRGLSISTAWEETKAILARDGKLFAAVALALIVLPQVVLAVVGTPIGPEANALSRIVYVAALLLGLVSQIAFNRLAIGPSVTVAEAISQGLLRLLPVFVTLIVVAFVVVLVTVLVAAAIGGAELAAIESSGQPPAFLVAILLVLLVLVFAILQLIFPLAAIETGNPLRLVARSWQLARKHYLRLLAFIIIVFVGLGAVVVATQLGAGSLIILLLGRPSPASMSALLLGLVSGVLQAAFTVVTAAMLARIYVQLAARGGTQPSVPSSGI
jgi:hypothetical protein